MYISSINLNSQYKIYPTQNNNVLIDRPTSIKKIQTDKFEKTSQANDINFTGFKVFSNMLRGYIKNRSYQTSLNASKYFNRPLTENLAPMVKEVKIKVSPKEEIIAWDINPNDSKNYVIYLHGFSQNITANQPLYEEMAKSKFGILAIEYRGYGQNPPSKHTTENDIIQDIRASKKYLEQKGIKNIGLVGHSFGGYLGAKISNLENFKFLVLVAPMTSLEFWLKNVIKHPKKYKTETFFIKNIPGYMNQFTKIFNIEKHVEQNTTPTIVIQATHDKYVRLNRVNEIVKKMPNVKKYLLLHTGGHSMDEPKINAIKESLDSL